MLWGQLENHFKPLIPDRFFEYKKARHVGFATEIAEVSSKDTSKPSPFKDDDDENLSDEDTNSPLPKDKFMSVAEIKPIIISKQNNEFLQGNNNGNTEFDKETGKKKTNENEDFLELEIYKKVKKEPFFYHYITNELRYFADRQNEVFSSLIDGTSGVELSVIDQFKYDKLADWKKPN